MTRYTKLNSQGNDFILIESNKHFDNFTIDDIKHYSRRDVVGCDQFLLWMHLIDQIYSVMYTIKMAVKHVNVVMD